MAEGYTDRPHNIGEIEPFIITDREQIIMKLFEKDKCYFYDTCSFRRHANLRAVDAKCFFKYIKDQNSLIIITRCVLMELASHSGTLNGEYNDYIKRMKEYGIDVLILYEEDIFEVLEMCFNTNAAINSYLCWTVRMMRIPVSTISETLEQNDTIKNMVVKGKNLDRRDVYRQFFQAVRNNKTSGDNLGEELLAICLHILSHLPGENDGKFCIITDDKGAAGKIHTLFHETARQHRGKRIIILSTPKLVQILKREDYIKTEEQIQAILETGTDGNIVVLGTLIYDIRSREISIGGAELAELVMEANGINIIF